MSLTPPELAAYYESADASKWRVRVIPNKFPTSNLKNSSEKRRAER
ncbi:MAG: hypothetical protein QXI59_01320 [Candidatus Bathyarchaeia archaeon]